MFIFYSLNICILKIRKMGVRAIQMWDLALLISYCGSMHFMACCRTKLNVSDFKRNSYCFNDLSVLYAL